RAFARETWLPLKYERPRVEEFGGRIEKLAAASPWLVAEDDESGALLGYAYADRMRARPAYQWAVEATVYVDRASHRRGRPRALSRRPFSPPPGPRGSG